MKPKKKTSDRRTRRTRHKVSGALVDLIKEKRFDDITVQNLIDRAGVGRSTFYTHFRDKEDAFVWFSMFPDQAAVDQFQRALAQSTEWRTATGQLTAWTHRRIETLRLQPTARSRLQAP